MQLAISDQVRDGQQSGIGKYMMSECVSSSLTSSALSSRHEVALLRSNRKRL